MAEAGQRNVSAATFAWLSEALAALPGELWKVTRGRMLGVTQAFGYSQDWVSDFWLARSSQTTVAMLVPKWDPPELLDEWPTHGVEALRGSGLRTNHSAFVSLLQENSVSVIEDHDEALTVFLQRESEIQRLADVRMIQGEHVRAWLGTALGRLLMSIALTPQDSPAALVQGTVDRLAMPLQFQLPSMWVNEFEERRLDLLYNLRVTPEGKLVASDLRVGQGETWRESWGWLTAEIGAAEMLDALRVAARLMRCLPLVAGLQAALQTDQLYLRTIALAVLRRWLLTLKTMVWLETALQHTWEVVRPQDLACFAYNAVKPEWPHRLLGISHRSADVKNALIRMKVWQSSWCAIDANYVPAWETNTGMMWGLFAASPAIARIASPTYMKSVWCRREFEITQYLLDHSDYLEERWVIDVEQANLVSLDELPVMEEQQTLLNSFPPLCHVWAPKPMPEWEAKILRAAAVLRLMNVFLGNAELANRVAAMLAGGMKFPAPAPTNNPNGWEDYARIFAELRALTGDESPQLPLRLPASYSEEDRRRDNEWSQRIPDLRSGTPDLCDILVALEWYRVEWPAMVEQRRGDLLVIDCQSFTAEQWRSNEQVCLLRGLAALRAPGPLWFLQLAGQEVENWPLVGDRPIFTEHISSQFGWMIPTWLERAEAQALYPSASGLEFTAELAGMCRNGA